MRRPRRAKKRSRRSLLSELLQKASAKKPEKETASPDLENEDQYEVTLSEDLLYKIFTLLPVESLFRIQFVCKKWFSLIKSPFFITTHTQQSETVLICRSLTLSKPGENTPKSYFHFLDLEHEEQNFIESSVLNLVHIRASCDGLILATSRKNESLVLMNPVTRKHIELPSAEVSYFSIQSFGIAFDNVAKTYKVANLFLERSGSTGCRILNIRTRKWTRKFEGPVFESVAVVQIPISVGESIYWTCRENDCVSLNVHDHKFNSKKLPVTCVAGRGRLVEIGGRLGFITCREFKPTQVWILMNEKWMKQYSINLHVGLDYPVPICSSRNGKRLLLESSQNRLCVYEFETCETKLVPTIYDEEEKEEGWFERIVELYIPHRNTLASWEVDYNEP